MSTTLPSSVLSKTGSVPASPSNIDHWIVPVGATGAWTGQDNKIAWFENSTWKFSSPSPATKIWVKDEKVEVFWNGTSWDGATVSVGTPNGVAGLDADSKVPLTQLPAVTASLGAESAGKLPLLNSLGKLDSSFGVGEGGASTFTGQISSWQPYTPALTNASVGSGSTKFFWRREGESIRIRGTISFGSGFSITGPLYFGLPNGLTIDNTKTSNGTSYDRVGYANCYSSSVAGFTNDGPQFTVIQDVSSNRFYIQGLAIGTNCNFVSTSWPFTWAAGNQIHIMDMLVPIAEWSSNINLVQEQQEFYSCDGTGAGEGVAANTQYTSSSPVKTPSGSLIPAVVISSPTAQTGTAYRFNLNQPLSLKDKVFLEFSSDQGASWVDSSHGGNAIAFVTLNNVPCGWRLFTTSTQVGVLFSNAGRVIGVTYGTSAGDWATVRNSPYFWRWRIRVVRNANFAQLPTTNIQTPMVNTPGGSSSSVVPLNLSSTFTSNGGPVKIQASGIVAANTLPGNVGMNIIVDGVTYASRYGYINAGAIGNFKVDADCYIPSLPAGSHTITLTGVNAVVNNGCLFNATTEEFVPAMASLTPKDVLYDTQIAVNSAVTATISRYHLCSGTTADYTVTLPPLAGNGGKRIAFLMSPALTKLVTIKGNGSELIDGQNTRIMWANESCILRAMDDESGWVKVGGKTIPMAIRAYPTSAQSSNSGSWLQVNLGAASQSKVPSGMLSGGRIYCKRGGTYDLTGQIRWENSTLTAILALINVNGIGKLQSEMYGGYVSPRVGGLVDCNAGDTLELYAMQYSGSNKPLTISDNFVFLSVNEIPSW